MMVMRQTEYFEREYVTPSCRVYFSQMQKGLCVSAGAIPPVEEEDAGIDGWGN